MRIRSIIIPLLATVMVLTLSLASISCDRLILISGIVYEWTDAPENAQSKIYHQDYSAGGLRLETIPEGMELQPIPNVSIRYFGKLEGGKDYDHITSSDEKGEFKIAISTGQGDGDIEYFTWLEVTKSGYRSTSREIIDRGDSHTLKIVLVSKSE